MNNTQRYIQWSVSAIGVGNKECKLIIHCMIKT